MEDFKKNLAFLFEDTSTTPGKIVDIFLLVINAAACFLYFHTSSLSSEEYGDFYNILDDIIVGIFILEYLARYWVAPVKRKYVFSLMGLIDLLVILPSILSFGDYKFLRIFRVFRIFRFARFFTHHEFFFGEVKQTHLYASRIIFTLFALIFVSSGMIYSIEKEVNPENFSSMFDAFYFSIVTLTTVGFGDIVPLSFQGKLVTLFSILFGIAVIPYQIGVLVKTIITGEKVDISCLECGLSRHDQDAVHCKHCGSVMYHKHS